MWFFFSSLMLVGLFSLLLFIGGGGNCEAFIVVPSSSSSSSYGDGRRKKSLLSPPTSTSLLSSSASTGSSTTEGPISSSSSSNFDWTKEWYPLAPVCDLRKDAPNKLTILGMDLAVWYDSTSSTWKAFSDKCPHRLVPLSEGRIETDLGVLQCAYHGWEYDGNGNCVRIPQLPDSEKDKLTSQRACVTAYPVQIRQGLLWVFPTPDTELANQQSPALIPELDDPKYVDATGFYVRDLPYSWDVLVENLCDPSHIPFAHHTMMAGANRNDVEDVNLEIVEETSRGFKAKNTPYPLFRGKYDVKFSPPCLLYYKIVDENKTFLGLGQYCVPTGPGRSRLLARFPFNLRFKPAMYMIRKTPRWINHFSQNVVLDSDVVFLSTQDETLTNGNMKPRPNYYMPAKCDTMVTAFRNWLTKHGNNHPKWLGIPSKRSDGEPTGWMRPMRVPARSGRDALLDRYRQHVEQCSSCRNAHQNLYLLREICYTVGIALCASAAASAWVTGGGYVVMTGGVDGAGAGVGMLIGRRRSLALLGSGLLMLMIPRLFLRPLIQRLECVPWPRKSWQKPSKTKFLKRMSRTTTKTNR